MKQLLIVLIVFITSCQPAKKPIDKTAEKPLHLTKQEAAKLSVLPLKCVNKEYPNKLSQVLTSDADLKPPRVLHPCFYGCFDWHSSVHGHWSLVKLMKEFPNMPKADSIIILLSNKLSKENMLREAAYFKAKENKTYERTYGWAWLLKLSSELHTWNAPVARKLEQNLQPLTDTIVKFYKTYLPKLRYPIRVGTHTNTAFGLSFAMDYAKTVNDTAFENIITKRAKDFFLKDKGYPLWWEPGGYDFLSPALEEIDIMRKVLPKETFFTWLKNFLPEITDSGFTMAPGEVSDRADGHMVHLDGVNFSRAWCLYGLAKQYPEFDYLIPLANKHVNHSLPNLMGDSYEGGHWLASFAINALTQ